MRRKKCRMVIIEDDQPVRLLLRYKFVNSDFEILELEHGWNQIDRIFKFKPHVILLDLITPFMSGKEFVVAFRKEERRRRRKKRIPIVVVSVRSAERDVVDMFQLGVDDYVEKPFSPNEVRARVMRLVDCNR